MTDPHIHDWQLPYAHVLRQRDIAAVDLVVIHCTELPDLAMARRYGERLLYDSGTGNSGHFYIDRDGSVHCFVAGTRIAHHTHGYNERSIGIELVNTGRYPDWLDSRCQTMTEAYTGAQVTQLTALLHHLQRAYPNLRQIAGHEDLDTASVAASDDASRQVFRKRDPGTQFPWDAVLAACDLQRIAP